MRKLAVITILLILTFVSVCPAHAAYETGDVIKTILSNGVTILVKPEDDAKVAAVEILVRVGAQNETVSTTGVGQLLAGSILAGTTRRSTIKLARLVAEAGGNFHSLWQWNYIEAYAVTLPNSCQEAISLLSDSIQNAALDPIAIDFSRDAIQKEMRRQDNDAFNSAYTGLRRLMYDGTPYGRPYLGDSLRLPSITREQVQQFYDKNFTPDRIIVSVVGNVDPDVVRSKVEVCFKNMDLYRPRNKPLPVTPASSTKREMVVRNTSPATYVMIGYPAPGVDDPDYSAMNVANVLLGGNKSSLLFTQLREARGLGYQVGSQYPAMQGGSLVAAYLGMDSSRATPDAIKTVEDLMIAQVQSLKSGSFTDDDLARAKSFLIGRHALAHERTRDRAFALAWSEAIGLGYQADVSPVYEDGINKITRADVLRVCNKYFGEPSILVYTGAQK